MWFWYAPQKSLAESLFSVTWQFHQCASNAGLSKASNSEAYELHGEICITRYYNLEVDCKISYLLYRTLGSLAGREKLSHSVKELGMNL
jgi:hypothetical protein